LPLLTSISSRMLWYCRWSDPGPADDGLFRPPESTISREPFLTCSADTGWDSHSQAKYHAVPIREVGGVGAGTASSLVQNRGSGDEAVPAPFMNRNRRRGRGRQSRNQKQEGLTAEYTKYAED
jgi:hypothetical protein